MTLPLVVLTSLFFMWGLITSLNDILVPHLKNVFTLSYTQATLIQFSFFAAYFVASLPAGELVRRIGYQRGIVLGLVVAASGCVLFTAAAAVLRYPLFLAALFVLAGGITVLQVAANPYVTVLGPPETASSRLNLTQAFNSLGTTLGPFLGASLILGGAAAADQAESARLAEAARVQMPYWGLAAVLCLLALLMAWARLPRVDMAAGQGAASTRRAWQYRHLVLGALGIFAYVGAEVSIGSFLVSFLEQPGIAGLTPLEAGRHLSFYWGGAMLGRFIGAGLMKRLAPQRLLAVNALLAAGLIAFGASGSGSPAMWALLLVGLCNSIMFPTIFALALQGLGDRSSEGSGVLCMAIVGGALVPVLQGAVADHAGLALSFAVPALCYAYILFYGLWGHRPTTA
jgi:FHS family L-fucose permease-like MFS transporter